jgi:membrane-associated phospholipid phosphatase
MRKFLGFLLPVDLLLITNLLILTVILLLFGKNSANFSFLIFFNLIFLFSAILCSFLKQNLGSKILAFCFALFPLIVCVYLYNEAGKMVHIFFPHWFDYVIVNFETNIFGILPNFWLEQYFSPILTEILMFAYFVYIPMLPFLCIYFHFRKSPKALNQFLFPLILAYSICFLGFFLFPAQSPRFFLNEVKELDGFIFREIMLFIEGNGQFQGGSFPSAHCAAGTVMILISYRYSKKLFAVVCPLIILFFFATVYGRYHYFSDVVAGILIGWGSVYLSKKLWL